MGLSSLQRRCCLCPGVCFLVLYPHAHSSLRPPGDFPRCSCGLASVPPQVYWHSSAHILGEALELHYGGLLCCSPPGDGGFHYDVYLEDR